MAAVPNTELDSRNFMNEENSVITRASTFWTLNFVVRVFVSISPATFKASRNFNYYTHKLHGEHALTCLFKVSISWELRPTQIWPL